MKNKKISWVFVIKKYGKFWSVSLEHFIKHKPLFSEECSVAAAASSNSYVYLSWVLSGGVNFVCHLSCQKVFVNLFDVEKKEHVYSRQAYWLNKFSQFYIFLAKSKIPFWVVYQLLIDIGLDHLQLTLLNWDIESLLALNIKLIFPTHFHFFI